MDSNLYAPVYGADNSWHQIGNFGDSYYNGDNTFAAWSAMDVTAATLGATSVHTSVRCGGSHRSPPLSTQESRYSFSWQMAVDGCLADGARLVTQAELQAYPKQRGVYASSL